MKNEEISLNTKKTLAESLKKAMKKKPFQKITVSELIQDCNINRKTFYYHFEDIYALLKWMLEEEAINVVKHFDLMIDYEEAFLFVADYIEENEYLIHCAYDSIGRDELKRFFYADFYDVMISVISNAELELGVKLDPAYRQFLGSFYVEALAGTMIDWIKNRDKRDRNAMMQHLFFTIRESLTAVIKKAGEPAPALR